jgi:hypothetical protein
MVPVDGVAVGVGVGRTVAGPVVATGAVAATNTVLILRWHACMLGCVCTETQCVSELLWCIHAMTQPPHCIDPYTVP